LNDELLIKRHQQRPGHYLADWAEVGLPVYSLNVQALTLAHKTIPPIEEFLLRCMAMDLCSVDEISQYLGLTREVLKPAFINLNQTENIALTAQQGMQSWSLTQKGRTTLQTSEIIAPEERTFSIHFDAILRKPTLYRSQRLLRYRELGEEGLIEIEAYPPKRPQPPEISPGDIERILRNTPGLTERRRDVLAIRSLENTKKVFIRAVALLFRGAGENETQLAFLIDGRLSTEHELAFAQTEGFKRITHRLISDAVERTEIRATKESIEVLPSLEATAGQIDASTIQAEVQVAKQSEALRLAESEQEKAVLLQRLKESEEALERLRAEAKKLPIRNLYVLDHPPLLQDAVLNAQRRMMIISPWITAKVVNREFVKRLEELLRKQVAVYIGYGISEEETQNLYAKDQAAREDLRQLARKYSHFCFVRLGNTHAKVLIKDSDFAAVTSFNWLSFKGDPDRAFRDEQGILLQEPGLVDQKFNELVMRFDQAANSIS